MRVSVSGDYNACLGLLDDISPVLANTKLALAAIWSRACFHHIRSNLAIGECSTAVVVDDTQGYILIRSLPP